MSIERDYYHYPRTFSGGFRMFWRLTSVMFNGGFFQGLGWACGLVVWGYLVALVGSIASDLWRLL